MDSMPESKGAFGMSGQIAISGDFQLGFESRKTKPPAGDSVSSTTVTLAPALDYFVADSISVGGQLAFSMSKTGDAKTQLIGIAPRVGYNIGFTENLSFWPKVYFQYALLSLDDGAGGGSVSGNKMTVGVNAPILFHPAEHFFIGLGPTFSMDLASKIESNDASKDTAFGLGSVVGGWF
jgi:long-subunit fatty acid transport protein